MDDEAPRLVYNPDDGSVELHLGGRSITVDGIDTEIAFERMTPDGEAASPVWLARAEADVLRKMVRYILDRVRITEESKATLAGLLPRVELIADADEADDGDGRAETSGGTASHGTAGGRDEAGATDGRGGRDDSPARGRGEPGGPINVPGVRRGLPKDDDAG